MKNLIKATFNNFRKIFPWQLNYFINYSRFKHRLPNLFNPRDYSEFIFRDNILGRHNKHAYLADKYKVREYVKARSLGFLLTELFGVWDNPDSINFDDLPSQFALKCNHSCGMNIICFNKHDINEKQTRDQLQIWLHTKHPVRFEQHYRKIKPLIICEELIKNNSDGSFPIDYKFHCANGVPVFIQCCFDRTKDKPGKRIIYDLDWNNLNYVIHDPHYSEEEEPRPKHLSQMIEYASILSKGLEYSRVDFYDTDDRVIFGEITLTPMGGWLSYFKQEALLEMKREIIKHKND